MRTLPIMPFVALVLLALPVRLSPRHLAWLAFALWLLGGVVLCVFGTRRLLQAGQAATPPVSLGLGVAVSVGVGFAKGRWLLSKTASRNIERLGLFTEKLRPIHVYGARSWIVISVMVAVSLALNLGSTPLFWRGTVNLAVGVALLTSSLSYLIHPKVNLLRSA